MRRYRTILLVAALIAVPTARAEDGPAEVKLRPDASTEVLRLITPNVVLGKEAPLTLSADRKSVEVAGQPRSAGVASRNGIHFIAIDCDGDGKFGRGEVQPIGRDGLVKFTIPPSAEGAPPLNFACKNLYVRPARAAGESPMVQGKLAVASAMQGRIGNVPIRLLDQDLSGGFTQDGADAICIGRSRVAIPLRQVHRIGTQLCELSVAADGSTLTVTPLTDVSTGRVLVPIASRALQAVVLQDGQGRVFDVAGGADVPAGDYTLLYGVLADTRAVVPFVPGKDTPTYPITADKQNILRMGGPIVLDISVAHVTAKNALSVSARIGVVGAGGETYLIPFRHGGGVPAPTVAFLEGQRKLAGGAMGYG